MAQDSDSFIREIKDDLRQERFQELWKKYGSWVMVAAVALVLGVGVFKVYQNWQDRRASVLGSKFQSALVLFDEKNLPEANKLFEELSRSGQAGYASLAKFRLAVADAASGKSDEATRRFDQIGSDQTVDETVRDLARLRAAMLRVDTADWTEVQNRLTPLKSAKGTYRFSARELLGLAAWKAGRNADAEKEFQALLDDRGVPRGLRQRAEMLLALLLDAKGAPLTVTPIHEAAVSVTPEGPSSEPPQASTAQPVAVPQPEPETPKSPPAKKASGRKK